MFLRQTKAALPAQPDFAAGLSKAESLLARYKQAEPAQPVQKQPLSLSRPKTSARRDFPFAASPARPLAAHKQKPVGSTSQRDLPAAFAKQGAGRHTIDAVSADELSTDAEVDYGDAEGPHQRTGTTSSRHRQDHARRREAKSGSTPSASLETLGLARTQPQAGRAEQSAHPSSEWQRASRTMPDSNPQLQTVVGVQGGHPRTQVKTPFQAASGEPSGQVLAQQRVTVSPIRPGLRGAAAHKTASLYTSSAGRPAELLTSHISSQSDSDISDADTDAGVIPAGGTSRPLFKPLRQQSDITPSQLAASSHPPPATAELRASSPAVLHATKTAGSAGALQANASRPRTATNDLDDLLQSVARLPPPAQQAFDPLGVAGQHPKPDSLSPQSVSSLSRPRPGSAGPQDSLPSQQSTSLAKPAMQPQRPGTPTASAALQPLRAVPSLPAKVDLQVAAQLQEAASATQSLYAMLGNGFRAGASESASTADDVSEASGWVSASPSPPAVLPSTRSMTSAGAERSTAAARALPVHQPGDIAMSVDSTALVKQASPPHPTPFAAQPAPSILPGRGSPGGISDVSISSIHTQLSPTRDPSKPGKHAVDDLQASSFQEEDFAADAAAATEALMRRLRIVPNATDSSSGETSQVASRSESARSSPPEPSHGPAPSAPAAAQAVQAHAATQVDFSLTHGQLVDPTSANAHPWDHLTYRKAAAHQHLSHGHGSMLWPHTSAAAASLLGFATQLSRLAAPPGHANTKSPLQRHPQAVHGSTNRDQPEVSQAHAVRFGSDTGSDNDIPEEYEGFDQSPSSSRSKGRHEPLVAPESGSYQADVVGASQAAYAGLHSNVAANKTQPGTWQPQTSPVQPHRHELRDTARTVWEPPLQAVPEQAASSVQDAQSGLQDSQPMQTSSHLVSCLVKETHTNMVLRMQIQALADKLQRATTVRQHEHSRQLAIKTHGYTTLEGTLAYIRAHQPYALAQ